MAILQSNQSELRYLKRQHLDQEAKIIGNYYRDIIRSYGVDCHYYKLDTTEFENFTDIVDQNTILKHAYGYETTPDYHLSVHMLTFMEVENDIFQLQKYGLNPNMDVNFYFDSNDFACALATRAGQYKEYKIDEVEISCEVPYCEKDDPTKNHMFPYKLGLLEPIPFNCEILSGKLSAEIPPYKLNRWNSVVCKTIEHSDFKVEFPVNEYLYKSFKHVIKTIDYLDTLIFLKYKIQRKEVNPESDNPRIRYKYILTGKVTGQILFYDIYKIGKYMDKIHPEVGDIVTIDFPDEKNRERFEIVDCYDKQLTTDGISPLLHNYVWKCKARKYIDAQENAIDEQTEGNERVKEKLDFTEVIRERVTDKISMYPNGEDKVYGGYEGLTEQMPYDKEISLPYNQEKYEFLAGITMLDIFIFACGSKLVTDGYDLVFINADEEGYKLTLKEDRMIDASYFESGLRFIKASKEMLVFTNIEGKTFKIAEDREATQSELQFCLNSLFDKTMEVHDINNEPSDLYKFKESRTILWADERHLYCKLASNGVLYRLA